MVSTFQCLYCGFAKPSSAFNKEHVLPQAFGTYTQNFVLQNTVCRDCNQYFADHLELHLARDSAEGLQRFTGPNARRPSMSKFGKGLMRCYYRGGEMDGVVLEWRAADGKLKVFPVNQVGFGTTSEPPFRWFPLSEFPSRDHLSVLGVAPESAHFRILVEDEEGRDSAIRLLRDLGYDASALQCAYRHVGDGGVGLPVRIEGTINRVLMRAIAKIAVNYLAYHFGAAIARLENFSGIRDFVRHGNQSLPSPVRVTSGSVLAEVPADRQLLAHTLTLRPDFASQTLLAHVSFYSIFQYEVTLGDNLVVQPRLVEKGHVFDPFGRQIVELTRDPSKARRPLPMAAAPEE